MGTNPATTMIDPANPYDMYRTAVARAVSRRTSSRASGRLVAARESVRPKCATEQRPESTDRRGSMVKAELVSMEQIERVILVLRGQRVILDAHLAALYGVTTSNLN